MPVFTFLLVLKMFSLLLIVLFDLEELFSLKGNLE